jgi:hypothetical protein
MGIGKQGQKEEPESLPAAPCITKALSAVSSRQFWKVFFPTC